MSSAGLRRFAPIYRVAELRAVEARFASLPLMERAGEAAAKVAHDMLRDRSGPVVVLAGPGNNGGDGFVVARWLRAWFHDVAVVFLGNAANLPADAAAAHAAFVAAGGTTVDSPPAAPTALVIDALFGIGFARPLPSEYANLVHWTNAQPAPVLALDIPTGLHADTGIGTAPLVLASATATFIALKPGLLTAQGLDMCGALSVHDLGLDAEADRPANGHALDWPALATQLPEPMQRRARSVHKGTFGTLAIVGGAPGMVGALLLAGRGALRAGAGKIWLGFLAADHPTVDAAMPELMLRDANDVIEDKATAWLVGCGLGTSEDARGLLMRAIASDKPLALDADALNLLARDASLRGAVRARDAVTLVTPHPAEAARLLDVDVAGVQHDRVSAALAVSRELRAHVALKGAGTILAHPDGSWDINLTGNPALASAGSGDVLAGILGACLAQGIEAKAALRVAVCVHGAAADALIERGVGPLGVGASELPDVVRELLNRAGRDVAGQRSARGGETADRSPPPQAPGSASSG
jgi:hydroxyethylthiazole kinase-like uncharacterized protein yjeF